MCAFHSNAPSRDLCHPSFSREFNHDPIPSLRSRFAHTTPRSAGHSNTFPNLYKIPRYTWHREACHVIPVSNLPSGLPHCTTPTRTNPHLIRSQHDPRKHRHGQLVAAIVCPTPCRSHQGLYFPVPRTSGITVLDTADPAETSGNTLRQPNLLSHHHCHLPRSTIASSYDF